MKDDANVRVEGFAMGRLLPEAKPFEIKSAGPQGGQYNPVARHPDGTPFKTGTNRGRPKGGSGLGIGHTKETKAAMVERYQAGEGLNPIAAAYSTSVQRVREIIVQAGVTIRSAKRSEDMAKRVDEEKLAKMLEMREQGKGGPEIAAALGVSASTVFLKIRKAASAGMKSPSKTRRKHVALAVATGSDTDAMMNPVEAIDEPEPAGPYAAAKGDGCITTVTQPGHAARVATLKQYGFSDQEIAEQIKAEAGCPHKLTESADLADLSTGVDAKAEPATEFVAQQALARERARQLHGQARGLRPYTRPQGFDLGSLIQPGNIVTIARAVQGLVNEMNTIPGVTASFRFNYELTAGAG